jgi:hypothetical protein
VRAMTCEVDIRSIISLSLSLFLNESHSHAIAGADDVSCGDYAPFLSYERLEIDRSNRPKTARWCAPFLNRDGDRAFDI